MEMENAQVIKQGKWDIHLKKGLSIALRYISKIGTIIICAVLVFIIITSCITLFDSATHPGTMPSVFGYKSMSVLTGSMRPKINPGDLVIDTNIKNLDSVKIGTIVTYRNEANVLITHRVTKINTNSDGTKTYITKGDANPVADVESVTQSQLEGIEVAHIPYIGYIGTLIKTGAGVILLIVIPLMIMIGIEIKNYIKKSKNKTV